MFEPGRNGQVQALPLKGWVTLGGSLSLPGPQILQPSEEGADEMMLKVYDFFFFI